jgi:nitrogen regulatory protein PII
MTFCDLTRMIKVEVIVGGDDAPAVADLVSACGATGYTAVTGVSGLGHHGYHQGALLFNDQAALQLLITVVPTERAEPLVVGLRTLLESSPGVMFVTDTYVSRPEYFS